MINKATLLGRIGKKETRKLKNDKDVTTLHVATTKKWLNQEGALTEETTWHTVNCYNKLAELAEKYTHVGNLIYLEGEICIKKKDFEGETRHYQSVTCTELKFIPGQKKQEEGEEPIKTGFQDDGIPF